MKFIIYTIYDNLSKDSAPPFVAVNDDVARRQVRQLIKDNREDFELVSCGIFDSEKMTVSGMPDIYPTRVEMGE